ncbi:MAG TPA: hypothetical protein VGG27_01350 [Magnetospirillaceae bacterium]|jgi:hypothetical protein
MADSSLAQEINVILQAPVVTLGGAIALTAVIWKFVDWAYALHIGALNERLALANDRLTASTEDLKKLRDQLMSVSRPGGAPALVSSPAASAPALAPLSAASVPAAPPALAGRGDGAGGDWAHVAEVMAPKVFGLIDGIISANNATVAANVAPKAKKAPKN